MKFTVAIGVFNGETYIGECLESLSKSLNNDNVEILVVDDGSKDNTVQISRVFEKNHCNIRVVEKGVNRGLGDNYNVAIKEAKGKYIIFMDGDDVLDIELLEKTVRNVELSADLLVFRHYKFSDDGFKVYDDRVYNYEEGKKYSYLETNHHVSHFIHDLIYKKSFLIENNILADDYYKLYNDMAFNMRIFQKAETVQFFNANIYGYRFSDGQSMNIGSLIKWRLDRVNMSKSMVKEYLKVNEDDKINPERIKIARRQAAGSFADAYMGMLFGDNIKAEIREYNQYIKQDQALWDSASTFAKVARLNQPFLYPLLKLACKYHIKYVLNNPRRKF